MSLRDDHYDDQYNGYNDRYNGGQEDGYTDDFHDGYGAGYENGGYADNGTYEDGSDQGYTDQYGNRYGDDTDLNDDDNEDGRYENRRGNAWRDSYANEADTGYEDGAGYDDYVEDGYEDEDYEDERRGAGQRRGSGGAGRGRAEVSNRVGAGRGQQGRQGNRKKRRIILLVVEIAVLLIVVLILYAVTRVTKVGKANLSEQDIQDNISETVKANTAMKGYRNIALFGVDSTEGQLDQRTRSDTIMIASINQDTGDVKLVSVYRDTLLNLSGSTDSGELTNTDNYNKVNAAYAKGGPEQAINVLNTNLDMNITDFVTIGFGGLTDVVNALGGIEIDVTQDEIIHLNNYQSTMAQELNMNYTEVTEPGLQTLDGLQTTAYCRIRYTRGWDYKRAARQRAVLYAIFNKAKQADPAALAQIANNAFNEIYTSMDLSTLVEDVSALANYNIESEDNIDDMANGFPQESARIQANLGNALGDCVVPRTLSNNVIWLHQFLFDDSSFQPSETVQTISDTIDDMTSDAVPEEMTDEDHT